jgi:isocitrate dehydrogenase
MTDAITMTAREHAVVPPRIPFIESDGTGSDIGQAVRTVPDAGVARNLG